MFKHLGPDSLTIPRQRREVFSFTAERRRFNIENKKMRHETFFSFFVLITLNSKVSRKTVCCKYSPPHFYFSPVFFPFFFSSLLLLLLSALALLCYTCEQY